MEELLVQIYHAYYPAGRAEVRVVHDAADVADALAVAHKIVRTFLADGVFSQQGYHQSRVGVALGHEEGVGSSRHALELIIGAGHETRHVVEHVQPIGPNGNYFIVGQLPDFGSVIFIVRHEHRQFRR